MKKINDSSKKLQGIAVSPETPRIEADLYWGYQIRYADSFKSILFGKNFNLFKKLYNINCLILNLIIFKRKLFWRRI